MGNKGSKGKGKKDDKKASSPPAPTGPQELKFADRFRSVHTWAAENGFASGFPTFIQRDDGEGSIYGVILVKEDACEVKDLSAADLNNEAGAPARFRALHNYALENGFSGGYLTFIDKGTPDEPIYTCVLFKEGMCDVELLAPGIIGQKAEQRFRDAHKWVTEAGKDEYVTAFNTFATVEVEEEVEKEEKEEEEKGEDEEDGEEKEEENEKAEEKEVKKIKKSQVVLVKTEAAEARDVALKDLPVVAK